MYAENPLNSGRSGTASSNAGAARYDYCIVFPKDKDEMREDAINAFRACGCELYQYWSHDRDQIFVLLRVSETKLRIFADKINFKVLLNQDALIQASNAGYEHPNGGKIAPFEIQHRSDITPIMPYEYIYSPFKIDPSLEKFFASPFPMNVRLKLTYLLLQASPSQGGAGLELRGLLSSKHILGYFPLHDDEERKRLSADWLTWVQAPWNQPIDAVKEYLGEKIALYFTFLGHYTTWLIFPSILGLICQIIVASTGDFSHPILPFFGLFIAMWSVFMLEFWKRKEVVTAYRWGMEGFEQKQLDRPEFKGDGNGTIKSFIDGSDILYFPPQQQAILMCQSFTAIGSLATVVLGAVIAIYVIRRVMYDTSVGTYSSTVASILNSVQITMFNIIYSKLADSLTERENHRTDTTFEDSMIAKLFLFQFVNSYTSFFYLAFVAKYVSRPPGADPEVTGECGYSDCMVAIAINLGIIFGTRLTLSNAIELLDPIVKSIMKGREEHVDVTTLSAPEREFLLEPYDLLKGSLNDYAELAIQFGYMAFFVTALPASVIGAFINNYAEMRTDAYKLVHGQRPLLAGAEDIGTWQSIFSVVATISVITNAGIIAFTMSVLEMYSFQVRVWLFIGFQWLCFLSQFIIQVAVPDVPYEIEIQQQRTEHIYNKLILRIPDDEIDIAKANKRSSTRRETNEDFVIHEEAPSALRPGK
jgi:anoctamin-10/anoctamin-7